MKALGRLLVETDYFLAGSAGAAAGAAASLFSGAGAAASLFSGAGAAGAGAGASAFGGSAGLGSSFFWQPAKARAKSDAMSNDFFMCFPFVTAIKSVWVLSGGLSSYRENIFIQDRSEEHTSELQSQR